MSETMNQTAPCSAIIEKKTHRPGGCMSIFFQFFDWNRKFAKKKLFSRKLLLPARGEQASKRFGGNQTMLKSKIHLIADENSGGFPNVKMKSYNNNNNNSNASEDLEQKRDLRSPSLVARLMGLEYMPAIQRENPKKVSSTAQHIGKEEKLPNAHGLFYREGLSLDSNRSPKLEPWPQKVKKIGLSDKHALTGFGAEGLHIKSVLSRAKHNNASRTSRLIDVATRILEPGLQATNRAKFTLAHSNSLNLSKNGIMTDKMEVMSPDSAKGYGYSVNMDKSLIDQNPCKNCCNLVGEQHTVYPASVSNLVSLLSSQNPEKNEAKPPSVSSFHNHERSRARDQNQVLKRDKMPSEARLSNLQSKRVSSGSNATCSGAKDLIDLNQSLISGKPCQRMISKVSVSSFDREEKSCSGRNDSVSPARKRRIVSGNRQVQSSGSVDLTFRKEKVVRGEIRVSKDRRASAKSRSSSLGKGSRVGVNDGKNVLSVDPGLREKTRATRELKTRKTCFEMDEDDEKMSLKKNLPLNGDALGALLEKTLKELNSQEEEKFAVPKKPTAVILQELISALTMEQPVIKDDDDDDDVPSTESGFQNNAKNGGSSLGFVHGGNHHSPGYVLEASFSNDSCMSSNLDVSSGDRPQSVADIQDSATSLKEHMSGFDIITGLLNRVSCLLISINENGLGLKGNQLSHATEVILNTELLFGDTDIKGSNRTRDVLIGPSLLDDLVILARTMWKSTDWVPGFEDNRESDKLSRVFLFNSMIECLDLKCCRYCNSGFRAWRKLPLCIDVETLVREGIQRWTKLAGMRTDEIVEWEMNHSLGKWIDFDIDAFETGTEIGFDILQALVEEVVEDLWMRR